MECKNCSNKIKGKPVIDFYNIEHCSDECAKEYKKYREKEYDNYVDPLGFYQSKNFDYD